MDSDPTVISLPQVSVVRKLFAGNVSHNSSSNIRCFRSRWAANLAFLYGHNHELESSYDSLTLVSALGQMSDVGHLTLEVLLSLRAVRESEAHVDALLQVP